MLQVLLMAKESLFVSPSKEIDNLLSQGLSRLDIAKRLGITDRAFLEGDLIRIDIDVQAMKNLRLPKGTETGANSLFKPGGKTSGGVSEGVVDAVEKTAKGVNTNKVQ